MGKDFIMDFTTKAMMSELSRECFNGNNEEFARAMDMEIDRIKAILSGEDPTVEEQEKIDSILGAYWNDPKNDIVPNATKKELFDLLIGGIAKVYKETGTLVPN